VGERFTQDVEFTYHMVRSQSDMESLIDFNTKGKYNISSVTVSERTSFLQEVAYSETRHSVIARLVIGTPSMQVAAPDQYRLTPEAIAMMRDRPERFRDIYGDYFISGCSRRAEFMVVYKFSSSDRSSLQDITTHLDVSAEGLFSKEGTLRLRQKAHDKGVEVSVTVHMFGLSEAADVDSRPPVEALPDISEALAWFASHAVGTTEVAQLTHYSRFDNDYSLSIPVPPEDFPALKELYDKLWLIRSRFHNIPEYYRRAFRERFSRLESAITARKNELPGKQALIRELDGEAHNLLHELQLVSDRMDFHARLREHRRAEGDALGGKHSSRSKAQWLYGITSAEQSEAITIHSETQHFERAFKHPAWSKREGSLVFGDGSKRLVVGVLITSNWRDGTNGVWKTSQKHFSLETLATVSFESEAGRGCNWTVTCYYVDADLYRFDA
jgi:hypothetical protein